MICRFLAEHNISFNTVDHLVPLLKKCFPDSKVAQNLQLKRTKATCIVKNVIGTTEKNELCNSLLNTKFSILVDESTDIATVKTACVVVRYFDNTQGKITSKLWELVQIFDKNSPDEEQEATAEHLFTKIIETFSPYKIPYENIIGCGSDGCNTMMGQNNSVATRMKDLCPGIYIFKCICHSLHICASEACKMLPRAVEDFARNVYSHFKNSSKRQCGLAVFHKYFDVDVHKILHPSQTRWLSLSLVVSRILEQWEPLTLYFQEQSMKFRLLAVDQIYMNLRDPFMKMYFKFLEWVLPKVTAVNQLFQTEKVIITHLHQSMVNLYQDLLCCYMERQYVMSTDFSVINPQDRSKCLNKNQMYLGVGVMNMLKDPNVQSRPNLIESFYQKCLEFFITLCSEIKKRYTFDDALLPLLSCFKKQNALSHQTRETFPSLVPIMNALPRIIKDDEMKQKIDNEWRMLPFYELPQTILQVESDDSFWDQVSGIQNEEIFLFKNLGDFVLSIFSLPHSNADCERVFSKVNLIRTKHRNKLINETINGLLLTSQHIKKTGHCFNFQPSRDML